uniref:Amiloride-sensitive sodium channel n=1 Tax=Bursaphelenchus xylophilus TaxID=6326 RepID=A0A1I7RU49_BURXY
MQTLFDLNSADSSVTINAKTLDGLHSTAARLTELQREELCVSADELIRDCRFSGATCRRDFKRTYNVDYGYCYTVNYNQSFATRVAGRQQALELVLYYPISEYLPNIESTGFKVLVHSANQPPFPDNFGELVRPGTELILRIQKENFDRLSSPYGDCDTLELLEGRGQRYYYDGDFTTEGCLRSCFQDQVYSNCSCADPRFFYDPEEYCSKLAPTETACLTNHIQVYGDFYKSSCDCKTACKEEEYRAVTATSQWPANDFYMAECDLRNYTGCDADYRENGAAIAVFFDSTSYIRITENPKITTISLFNEIAGLSGLWLGICSMFLAELLLLLIQFSINLLNFDRELPEVPSFRYLNIQMTRNRQNLANNRPYSSKSLPNLVFREFPRVTDAVAMPNMIYVDPSNGYDVPNVFYSEKQNFLYLE